MNIERATRLARAIIRAAEERNRLTTMVARMDREANEALRALQREMNKGDMLKIGRWTFYKAEDGTLRISLDVNPLSPNGHVCP